MYRVPAGRRQMRSGYTRTGGYYGRFTGNNPEKKFFDTALSFLFDTTGEVPATGQLCLIPQGDTESTRDGRECRIKSIQIRATLIFTPAAAATASTSVWLYVILDTQCNGAAAAVTDVFSENTLHKAMINLANSKRFRILKRFRYTFNSPAGATTAYNTVTKHIDWFKKCDIPMVFSSTSGAITEIRTNNVFLMAGSDVSDDTVSCGGNCRLRFLG